MIPGYNSSLRVQRIAQNHFRTFRNASEQIPFVSFRRVFVTLLRYYAVINLAIYFSPYSLSPPSPPRRRTTLCFNDPKSKRNRSKFGDYGTTGDVDLIAFEKFLWQNYLDRALDPLLLLSTRRNGKFRTRNYILFFFFLQFTYEANARFVR